MSQYNIGDLVSWKQKRSKHKGMIIEVLKERFIVEGSDSQPIDTAFIVQEENGYRILMLESELT